MITPGQAGGIERGRAMDERDQVAKVAAIHLKLHGSAGRCGQAGRIGGHGGGEAKDLAGVGIGDRAGHGDGGAAGANDQAWVGDLADDVVVGIGDINIAGRVNGETLRIQQVGVGCWSTITEMARNAGTGNRGDDAGGFVDLADHIIVGVGNVNIAIHVHRDTSREKEISVRGWSMIPVIAGTAVPSNGDDGSGRLDNFANSVVGGIGNEEIAGGINGHTPRVVKGRVHRGHAVTAVASTPIPGDRGDDTGRFHNLADAVVIGIGDEEIAIGIDADSHRIIKIAIRGGHAIAVKACASVTGNRDDGAGGLEHLTDAMVVPVSDEEIAIMIDGHTRWVIEVGIGGGDPITVVACASVTGDGDDDSGCLQDLADPLVGVVNEEEVAFGINGYTIRIVKVGIHGRDIVAVETCGSCTGHGFDVGGDGVSGACAGGEQHGIAQELGSDVMGSHGKRL